MMNEQDLVVARALAAESRDSSPGGSPGPLRKTQLSKIDDRLNTFRRTRSLNAPSPIQQFGPCGRIMKNSAMIMQIQDPASQRLTWYKPPLSVLVIKKVHDATILTPFVQLVHWLVHEKSMVVFVESAVLDDRHLATSSEFSSVRDKLMTFKAGTDDLTDKIDFIICLGGDGTLLHASSLFQQSVPPVMAFHLGSLGFLTPFEFNNFQEQVMNVLEGHAALTLRSRLQCVILRKTNSEVARSTAPTTILVLNEVVVDRGPSPYLSNIDLFLDGKHITSVQGDGVIVSTPTGSTAYAVAAGASMIHPSVPAILVTPICPHSLSFRPIVVPAGVELKITLSPDARNAMWVSFDGRCRQAIDQGDSVYTTVTYIAKQYGKKICMADRGDHEFQLTARQCELAQGVFTWEFIATITPSDQVRLTASVSFDGRSQVVLKPGDSLYVTMSVYPVPSICAQDQISDWFDSLAECLHWNVRKRQKQIDSMDNCEPYDMDTNHHDTRPAHT